MAKTTDEVLRDAADAAQKVLPSAEKEVEAAQRALQNASAKVVRLRAVIAAGYPEPESGPAFGQTNTVTFNSPLGNRALVYYGHGTQQHPLSIREQISLVLSTSKQSLSPREIAEEVEKNFGASIAQSTLYYILAKGEESGLLKKEDSGKWTIAKSEGR